MKNLVMTLLVRDEADILERNICFHLNSGVDFIVATDNGSVDGTRDILEKYKKKGVLEYIDEPALTYEQNVWVTRMVGMAFDKYNAGRVINVDADEFWYSQDGDIKKSLAFGPDLSYVNVLNYLPPKKAGGIDRMNKMVIKPIPCPASVQEKESSIFLLYEYAPKVVVSNKFRTIGYGNHMVSGGEEVEKVVEEHVLIHHFPIRSYKHFERKVVNGGSAYEKNPNKIADLGWHWKAWYRIYEEGKLKEEYEKINLENQEYLAKYGPCISPTRVPNKIKYSKPIFKFRKIRKIL